MFMMYLHHEDLLIKLVVKNLSELYFNLQLKMIKKLSDDLHSIQLVNGHQIFLSKALIVIRI